LLFPGLLCDIGKVPSVRTEAPTGYWAWQHSNEDSDWMTGRSAVVVE